MPATRVAILRSTSKPLCESSTTRPAPSARAFSTLRAHVLLADAEGPLRDQPARIGERRIGEGLAQHRDLDPALLEQLVGREHRLLPLGVAHVEREEGVTERIDQRLHARFAIGELPVPGHGVGREQLQAVDDVLPLGAVRAERALPAVAAIEEQHAVAALRAHRLDGGGEPVRARRCGRSSSPAPRSPRRSAHGRPADFQRCRSARGTALPVMCGGTLLASPTPRLSDGSRKCTGTSCACRSAICSSVTLPSASNLRSSSSVNFLLRERVRSEAGGKGRAGGADLQHFAAGEHARISYPSRMGMLKFSMLLQACVVRLRHFLSPVRFVFGNRAHSGDPAPGPIGAIGAIGDSKYAGFPPRRAAERTACNFPFAVVVPASLVGIRFGAIASPLRDGRGLRTGLARALAQWADNRRVSVRRVVSFDPARGKRR